MAAYQGLFGQFEGGLRRSNPDSVSQVLGQSVQQVNSLIPLMEVMNRQHPTEGKTKGLERVIDLVEKGKNLLSEETLEPTVAPFTKP